MCYAFLYKQPFYVSPLFYTYVYINISQWPPLQEHSQTFQNEGAEKGEGLNNGADWDSKWQLTLDPIVLFHLEVKWDGVQALTGRGAELLDTPLL